MEESSGVMGLWSRFVWTITSPKKLFADIAEGAHWWQPWVILSVINMLVAYISVPIQIQVVRLNPSNAPEDQLEQTVTAMEKFGSLGVISTPVVVLVTGLIIAGICYLAVSVLAESANFKKYFTLYLYASIVSSLGTLLGIATTRMRGVENIRSVEDTMASFGPAMLLGPGHRILHPILLSLDLFQIWFYVLMVMGVMHVFGTTRRSAIVAVTPLWLISVLIALVSSRISSAA